MILFIKLVAAVFMLLFLCMIIDTINNLRGKPSHYTDKLAIVLEGGEWLCITAGLIFFCVAAFLVCVAVLFG